MPMISIPLTTEQEGGARSPGEGTGHHRRIACAESNCQIILFPTRNSVERTSTMATVEIRHAMRKCRAF